MGFVRRNIDVMLIFLGLGGSYVCALLLWGPLALMLAICLAIMVLGIVL